MMTSTQYEVLYLDRFSDPMLAERFHTDIQQRFHLSKQALQILSSGRPIRLKRDLSSFEANKLESLIKSMGGLCWTQETLRGCPHYERRQSDRRKRLDRRSLSRGSSIQPDRRQNVGRRFDDRLH